MSSSPIPPLDCPDPRLREGVQGIARVAINEETLEIVVTLLRDIDLPDEEFLLDPRSYTLTGGQRLFPRIVSITPDGPPSPPEPISQLRLTLSGLGDFSIYTLTVTGPGIDPFFASRKLRFRIACDDPFDCRPPAAPTAPEPELQVAIDYLAKDYSSFRQALLDFIPTRLPAWTERSEADLGMMLLELFAYTGDQLSYMQDRVANEAFLSSASQRHSVALHTALLGYEMDPGAAAHTWLHFDVTGDLTLPAGFAVSNRPLRENEPLVIFETLASARLFEPHNVMRLFSWGNPECCLARTALSAVLDGSFPDLSEGDYVVFDDGAGLRDVVRLIAAAEVADPASPPFESPPEGQLTTIRWSVRTPLSRDYCVDRSVVFGNMVVATHGESIQEDLRRLTAEQIQEVAAEQAARKPEQRIPRQRLRLGHAPLAWLDIETLALTEPATTSSDEPTSFTATPRRSISTLQVAVDSVVWEERPSLLDSSGDDEVFRIQVNDDGEADVVFGNGIFGQRPEETSTVTAEYRVGGGAFGNVAAETLTMQRTPIAEIASVMNLIPATGGRDQETSDHARRFAPATFLKTRVAVTAADYQNAALELLDAAGLPRIQRANASFRWTGSWLTVQLGVDPAGGVQLTPELRSDLLTFLESRRLAGYDLKVTPATYVPIELILEFCVVPGFLPANVAQALQEAFSSRTFAHGRKGFFHPDAFTIGQPLSTSSIYATAMSVPGVEAVRIARLARMHARLPEDETAQNLKQGFLAVGADQVIRLDNDRNLRENGVLTVRAKGVVL